MQAADLWLLAAQAGGFAASIYNPHFWIAQDVKAIRGNGSKDTLLRTFHNQRALWRLAVAVVVGVVSSLPAWWISATLAMLLTAGQIAFNLCYFFTEFNPGLNLALELPYKSKWFVSWNPNGSQLDAWLWQRAWLKQGYDLPPIYGPHPETQRLAGEELQHVTTIVKWTGYALYMIFAIIGYSLSYGF